MRDLMLATLVLLASGCILNPMRTVRIREQCRQEVQAATMPPDHETPRARAFRNSRQQAMFQDCLHREF